MAMNFPNNPALNQMFMVGNDMWSWNGVSWEVSPPAIGGILNLSGLTSSGAVTITNNTAANSIGTGALTVSGGVSIAKDLYVGGKLFLTDTQLDIAGATFSNGVTISGSTTPSTEYFTVTNGAATPVTKFQIDTASGDTTMAGSLTVTGIITGKIASVAISDTAPVSPLTGSTWYNSTNGNFYIYYVDSNGGHWVQPSNGNQQAGYTLPNASSSVLGGVIIPVVTTSGIVNANGTIKIATASVSQIGGVQVDGVSIGINNSVISVNAATSTTRGGVTIPSTSGITNTSGTIGLATASTSQIGGVKIDGTTTTINASGQLVASPITLGTTSIAPGSSTSVINGISNIDGTGTVNLFNSATTAVEFANISSLAIGSASGATVINGALTIPGTFSVTGSSYLVSPAGTATIYPAVTGAIDNMVIGATTAKPASFTSVTVGGVTVPSFNDVFDFDDVSNYVDGFTNNFPLTYNQSAVAITSPFAVTVAIDGAIQPAFDPGYDLVWLSNVLPASKGYTIDANGNLQFAECPSNGSQVQVRSMPVTPSTHTKKTYPFKAVDIMMGF